MHALGHALALSGTTRHSLATTDLRHDVLTSRAKCILDFTPICAVLVLAVHVGHVKTKKCVTAKGSTPNTIMTLSNQESGRRTALNKKVTKNRYILSLPVSLAYRFVKMDQTRFRLGRLNKWSLKMFFLFNTTHSHNP